MVRLGQLTTIGSTLDHDVATHVRTTNGIVSPHSRDEAMDY